MRMLPFAPTIPRVGIRATPAQQAGPHAEWVTLFKAHFKFTGGEIVREFLLSTGYLDGAPPAGLPGLRRDPEAVAALAAQRRGLTR